MSRQTTLNVSLTPALRSYIQRKLRQGGYESASEVIREGLRALQQQDRGADAFWADLRAKVAVARKDVAAGRTVDGESSMDEIMNELREDAAPRRLKRRAS